MKARGFCTLVGAALLLVVIPLAFATPAGGQTPSPAAAGRCVVPTGPDRVSIRAEGIPLVQLLKEISAIAPMDLRVDPRSGPRPVTVLLDNVNIAYAIGQVLRESGVDFVVSGLERTDNRPMRIVLGDVRQAVPVADNVSAPSLDKSIKLEDTRTAENAAPADDSPTPPEEPQPAKMDNKTDGAAVAVISSEEQEGIARSLEATRDAVAAIPLTKPSAMEVPGQGNARPGEPVPSKVLAPAPMILPFVDKNGQPIPIVPYVKPPRL